LLEKKIYKAPGAVSYDRKYFSSIQNISVGQIEPNIKSYLRFLVYNILGEMITVSSKKGEIIIADSTMNVNNAIILDGENGVSIVGDDVENKVTISLDIDQLVETLAGKLPRQKKQVFTMSGSPVSGTYIEYPLQQRVILDSDIVILNGQIMKKDDDYDIFNPTETNSPSKLRMKTFYGTTSDPANIIVIYQY